MNKVETIRHSAILIASGGGIQTYDSLDEVPYELKRRLVESTVSPNSATLLIADKRGRRHLAEARAGRGGVSVETEARRAMVATRFPWTEAIQRREARERAAAAPRSAREWMSEHWPELMVPVAVAGALWFLLTAF